MRFEVFGVELPLPLSRAVARDSVELEEAEICVMKSLTPQVLSQRVKSIGLSRRKVHTASQKEIESDRN